MASGLTEIADKQLCLFISYFSFAVLKYSGERKLGENRAYFGLWFHEVRVHNGGEGMGAGARSREITFYPYTERERMGSL